MLIHMHNIIDLHMAHRVLWIANLAVSAWETFTEQAKSGPVEAGGK